jgi:ribose transport system permease protein
VAEPNDSISTEGGAGQVTSTQHLPETVGSSNLRTFIKRYFVVLLLPALIILFAILAPSTFFTAYNFETILTTNAVLIILAIGETAVLVTGEFDFSFGGTLGLSAAVVVMLITNLKMPTLEAVFISLLAALLVGVVNAYFVVKLKVKSFIVTLGMGTLTTGIGLGITGSQTISNPSKFLSTVMTKRIVGVGLPFFYGLILVAIIWFLLEYVKTGRNMYFSGEGRKAAFLAGIHVNKIRAGVLIFSAFTAWLAGMVMLGQTTAVDATYGGPYLLPVFAAVFLGFTTIRSGRFNALGTLVGVLVLAVGSTGLEILSVASWITQVFDGGVLIVAVGLANVLGGERIDSWL